MEAISPFDLETHRNNWIVGESSEDFYQKVIAHRDSLAGSRIGCNLIREEDPIEFTARFFAAVALGVPIALANPSWRSAEMEQFESLLADDDIPADSILIPTGGTTGGVKLAIHRWSSLLAAARGLQDFLGGGPIHSCCLLPLFHVSGLMQLVRSFVTGGKIRFDEDAISDYCLSLVPTQLQRKLQDESSIKQLKTARAIFVGGAAMPKPVADKARALRLPIIPVYGMTETAAMVAAVPNADFLRKPSAGAVPLANAKIFIEDDGRIRIDSPALFKGYHGRDSTDLSRGFIVDDEGRIDADGRLHVIGRVDRLINTGGEKVDPVEVEACLLEVAGVSEALVVGQADEEWGQRVIAYVVGEIPDDLLTRMKSQLAPYKIPKQIHQVGALPLDARGKFRH